MPGWSCEVLMAGFTLEKRQALIDLLSLPDTPDLRRGHRRTVEGRADRHLMLNQLAASFIQWHMLQMEEMARRES
jgi:hypothetical protein